MTDKTFPSRDKMFFMLCEVIREEANNKLAFLGVFTGKDILFPPNTAFPVTAPLISWAVFIESGAGEFKANMRIMDPTGEAIPCGDFQLVKKPGINATAFAQIFAPKLKQGMYRMVLELEGREFDEQFKVGVSA